MAWKIKEKYKHGWTLPDEDCLTDDVVAMVQKHCPNFIEEHYDSVVV